MNNYCTNCGKELQKKDLICSNCNTPIIDISNKSFAFYLLIIIFVCFLIFVLFKITSVAMFNYKIHSISKEYVEPYLNKYYDEYTYEYESSGKCIISGDCYFDPVMGCDGGVCDPYEYLDETECTSYYFEVKTSNEDFRITVYYKDKKYNVIKGNNINNSNIEDNNIKESIDEVTENDIDTNQTVDDEKNNEPDVNKNQYKDNIEENNKNYYIEQIPYESEYLSFNSNENHSLYLDKNNIKINFFSGILYDNSKIYLSGNIYNPLYLKGQLNLIIKYFDNTYSSIGECIDSIELLGKGYTNISFSCHTAESDLISNKKFDDIKYYQINITNYEITN